MPILGLVLARRPWFFILASVALSSGLIPGLLFWRMYNSENVETWFLPEAPIYQTEMWIRENFPEGVRYEQVIVAGPNVLTPEYFKYLPASRRFEGDGLTLSLLQMAALDRKIRSLEAEGSAWVDVCARPDEFLEGNIKQKRRERDVPNRLSPDESERVQLHQGMSIGGEDTSEDMANTESDIGIGLTGRKGHERTPPPSTTSTATRTAASSFVSMPTEKTAAPTVADAIVSKAQPEPEEITEESAQYDDYNYGWKEDSNEDVFGSDKKGKEKVLYEDKCIYSSSLLLWDEDFDFSAITKEEIRDKITRALDDESKRDVDVILSGVERDAEGRVVGATAVLSVYILKDRTNITNLQGQRIDPISEPWEAKFLEAVFHNDRTRPPGLEVYASSTRSYRDGLMALLENNRIYFVFGFIFITIYLAATLGKSNLLQQRCLENVVNAGGILKAEERVGEALKQAGVSITITTLTDIFAFGVGATTKIPMLRSFCIFTAVGILLVYVITLIFIVPILSLDEKRRDAGREGCLCIQLPDNYKTSSCSQEQVLEEFFHQLFAPLIVKKPVKVVVMLVTAGLFVVNCWGLSGLKNEFDRSWFLDQGYLREFLAALQELFPESGYRAEFYLGDADYFQEKESLLKLCRKLDGLPGVRDGSVEFWYPAFLKYLEEEKGESLLAFGLWERV
ncbi:unnamed protein product [Darwinula stevensoni]|uniref:SSD domain-containing protein n=1 Tax=Darwinula stevensoni TaxID=69355 RepID=A0A7R8ZZG4_9CRUS|nr:unnamed protein product [Darwinula stevensoni]CAG0883651.1 unnamed protein product [Darwinula stevensoni]